MTTYTKLEQTVFNLIATESSHGGCVGYEEIEKVTGINIKSLRGIVSSLVSKGRVDVDNEPVNGQPCNIIWPIHPLTEESGFWCDYMDQDGVSEGLISDEMVAQ